MRVDAVVAVVGDGVGAPDGLVLVDVEVVVFGQQIDHFDFDFGLGMGEGTKLLIVAFGGRIYVCLAELRLVPPGVVHLLYLVVRKQAVLVFAAGLTQLVGVVYREWAPPVQVVVVVYASFALVMV